MSHYLFNADYAGIERRLLATGRSTGECKLCEVEEPREVFHALVLKKTQVRFPRSKKSRIRKKWQKNPANFISEPVIVEMGRSRLEGLMSKISRVTSLDWFGVVGLPKSK